MYTIDTVDNKPEKAAKLPKLHLVLDDDAEPAPTKLAPSLPQGSSKRRPGSGAAGPSSKTHSFSASGASSVSSFQGSRSSVNSLASNSKRKTGLGKSQKVGL